MTLKKQQYKALIEENNNKPASAWKIFKELGVTKNKSKGMANCILVNGNEITDSQGIANKFNRFFVSVASQLKEPNIKPNFEILEKSQMAHYLQFQILLKKRSKNTLET